MNETRQTARHRRAIAKYKHINMVKMLEIFKNKSVAIFDILRNTVTVNQTDWLMPSAGASIACRAQCVKVISKSRGFARLADTTIPSGASV